MNQEQKSLLITLSYPYEQVKATVLADYGRSGGIVLITVVILFHILFIGFLVMGQIWLSRWSEDPTNLNATEQTQLRDFRLGIYGGLIASQSKPHRYVRTRIIRFLILFIQHK